MISLNFIGAAFRVLKEALNTIIDLFVSIYKIIVGIFYSFLPEPVAKVFMIMIILIIVGVLISYFLRNNIK